MNPHTQYLQIPWDATMPEPWQLVFTIVFGVAALGGILYTCYAAYKDRDPAHLLIPIGGAVCVFGEPIIDNLGMCFHPIEGQWVAIETFGRPIPYLIFFAYIVYYGTLVVPIVRRFQTGVTKAGVWKAYIVMTVVEFFFEPVALQLGVWKYYGHQPFEVFLFPLWWPFVNAAALFSVVTIVYLVRPYLKGIFLVAIIPLVLSGFLIGNAATAWPLWSALHTTQGYKLTYPAAILTLVLCGIFIQSIACLLAKKENNTETAVSGNTRLV